MDLDMVLSACFPEVIGNYSCKFSGQFPAFRRTQKTYQKQETLQTKNFVWKKEVS